MTLSDCAEGTPSYYEASSTFLDVGFHFYDDCIVDRPARGTTDWKTWRAKPRPQLESAIRRFDVRAGVGDRDTIMFRGFHFTLQEAMAVPDHWESFRVYLYDDVAGTAEPLDLRTDAGCVAFTNPVVELVELDHLPTLVAGMFVPGEEGPQCELGGLLYTRTLDDGGRAPVSCRARRRVQAARRFARMTFLTMSPQRHIAMSSPSFVCPRTCHRCRCLGGSMRPNHGATIRLPRLRPPFYLIRINPLDWVWS